MNCRRCGNLINESSTVCIYCGERVEKNQNTNERRNILGINPTDMNQKNNSVVQDSLNQKDDKVIDMPVLKKEEMVVEEKKSNSSANSDLSFLLETMDHVDKEEVIESFAEPIEVLEVPEEKQTKKSVKKKINIKKIFKENKVFDFIKNNSKKVAIGGGVFVFLVLVIVALSFGSNLFKKKNENEMVNENTRKLSEKKEENFEVVSEEVAEDRTLILKIKNYNADSYIVNLTVNFYDKDNVLLGTAKDSLLTSKTEKEYLVLISLLEDYADYDHYEVVYELYDGTEYVDYSDSFELIHSKETNKIVAKYKFDLEDELFYSTACVVYYKDKKTLTATCESAIEASDDGYVNFEFYNFGNEDENQFDDYKIYLKYAIVQK